jgi:hypothetical protein
MTQNCPGSACNLQAFDDHDPMPDPDQSNLDNRVCIIVLLKVR